MIIKLFIFCILFFWFTPCQPHENSSNKWNSNVRCSNKKKLSDEELMTKVQKQTFRYFWDYAHPKSGLARDLTGILKLQPLEDPVSVSCLLS